MANLVSKLLRGTVPLGALGLAILLVVTVVACNSRRSNHRKAVLSAMAKHRLHEVAFALHNYHADYGSLPPAFIADEDGTPMHSWRVLLLPTLGHRELYGRIDFTTSWNSEANAKLLSGTIPTIFQPPNNPTSTNTCVLALVGESAAFSTPNSASFDEFEDGLENTAILVAVRTPTVPWYAPIDLDVQDLRSRLKEIELVCGGDARVYVASQPISLDSLSAAATISGHEPVSVRDLERVNSESGSNQSN